MCGERPEETLTMSKERLVSRIPHRAPSIPAYSEFRDSFARMLRAANRSPLTVKVYLEAIDIFGGFLQDGRMPTDVRFITREHLELFMGEPGRRWKPNTVLNRYRVWSRFFSWLVDEGEIAASPLARMPAPAVPDAPPPVLAR